MKIFISADIEGTSSCFCKDDVIQGGKDYEKHRLQMTKELVAVCEGAHRAGADEILIKDAHGDGNSIIPEMLPEYTKLIRGWSYHPYAMVEGLDQSFDGAMFVGYHSGASTIGSPLAHTFSGGKIHKVLINGKEVSEFSIYSGCASMLGVPSVFVSGDYELCEQASGEIEGITTVSVKKGSGYSIELIAPEKALKMLEKGAYEAVCKLDKKLIKTMPSDFNVIVHYNHPADAERFSYYPGANKLDPVRIEYSSNDYFEVLRFFRFVL